MLQAFILKTKQNGLRTVDAQMKLLYEWVKTDVVNLREFCEICNWIFEGI